MFTVFFVDDEPYVIEGLRLMIDWDSYDIRIVGSANDGFAAYEAITRLKPDIVISDIKMPGLSGTELLKKCTDNMKQPPKFIMLSGYSEMQYIKDAMRYGGKNYMLKPIDIAEADETLNNVCNEIDEERERYAEIEEHLQYVVEDTFRKFLFSEPDERDICNAGYLLNVKDINQSLNMLLFRVNSNVSYDDIGECVLKLKEKTERPDTVIFYAGMKIIVLITAHTDRVEAEALAKVAQNFSDGITMVRAKNPSELKNAYEYAVKNIGFTKNRILRLSEHDIMNNAYQLNFNVESIVKDTVHGNKKRAAKTVKQIMRDMLEKKVPSEKIREFAIELLIVLYKYSTELAMNMESIYDTAISQIYSTTSYNILEMVCVDLVEQFADCAMSMENTDDIIVEREIMEYINNNFAKDITLADISKEVYLQASTVSNIVKTSTGMKFGDYLAYVRVEHAKKLLETTDKKITQIARECGYKCYRYFAKRFKELTEVLPSDYRNNATNANGK